MPISASAAARFTDRDWPLVPTGTPSAIASSVARSSAADSVAAVRSVSTSATPQPMSTPIA